MHQPAPFQPRGVRAQNVQRLRRPVPAVHDDRQPRVVRERDLPHEQLPLQFNGRIVIVGDTHIVDRLPCSQVIPDYTDALRKLSMKYDLDFYKRILILSAGHPNAVASERQIREILPNLGVSAEKIESLNLPCVNNLSAQMAALRHFSSSIPDFANTLLISLSDYFSRGIREVFREREEEMPDLLSIDNLEDYDTAQEEKSFLTAIDRRLPDIYEEGVRLLTRLSIVA